MVSRVTIHIRTHSRASTFILEAHGHSHAIDTNCDPDGEDLGMDIAANLGVEGTGTKRSSGSGGSGSKMEKANEQSSGQLNVGEEAT